MQATAQERITLITKALRKLWPKYDQDLDQLVDEKGLILDFIRHGFSDANYSMDYVKLAQGDLGSYSVEELIYQEAQIKANYITNTYEQHEIDSRISLN